MGWRYLLVVVALGVWAWSAPAAAGRSLDEPAEIGRLARSVPKAQRDAAFGTHTDRCSAALAEPGLAGLQCRALLVAGALRQRPITKESDVDARLSLLADLGKAATSGRRYEPLAPPPGHARQRFETVAALARTMLAVIAELQALPAGHAAAAYANRKLAAAPRPIDAACSATRDSVDHAAAADASLQERGELQGMLTSNRCFLDDSHLVAERKPGQALAQNDDATRVKATVGDVGVLRQYADSRAIEFERCTSRLLDAAGRPTDAAKLESCACGVIKRWTLPTRKSETQLLLPLGSAVDVRVVVAPDGRTTTCGPLQVKKP
jgi:hypothetical protein